MESAIIRYDLKETIQDLDPIHIPSAEPSAPRRRLVVVGDVHGHLSQLKRLLENVGFDKDSGDHLVFTGDLINKGPDSSGVVQLGMDLGASAVRGNNEDRVLAAHRLVHIGRVSGVSRGDGGVPFQNNSTPLPQNIPYAVSSDFITATQPSDAQVSWLSSLPLILRIGLLKGATSTPWNAGSLVIVHGGLVPSLSLEEQDPWAVMNMRSLVYPTNGIYPDAVQEALVKRNQDRWCRRTAFQVERDEELEPGLPRATSYEDRKEHSRVPQIHHKDAIPIEAEVGKLWRDAWNETQNLIKMPGHRTVAVYGHDARAGLQEQQEIDVLKELKDKGEQGPWTRYAFGLDSGCAYGNALSAMIIEPSLEMDDIIHRVEQVK
ncbi:ser/thr protein phosphatase family protein (calcineurin-like phosphoesterase) [Colletotrichum tofieldiae]|uniref:Ser/thr protein phosphatase family protein (Calcineurin-like phosphoesterase) n=1 Tax=Colletotrichum tofieldiae TaxID=708197 RepID=A0A161VP42_9PEZI|nr:ser/thr protein phosphatase family protein (calcineurin-like phosphoesterase) [Colletotrichum tofieldiae]